MLTFLLFDVQTHMRGQNGVVFDQESTGDVRFFQPSYWPTNERLKILTFFLVELQTSIRGQNGVEFDQESTGHVGFLLALLLADR